MWEYNLCWHWKQLNSTCILHVLPSGEKTEIHIEKDSFHVNWKKQKEKNEQPFKPVMVYTIAEPRWLENLPNIHVWINPPLFVIVVH